MSKSDAEAKKNMVNFLINLPSVQLIKVLAEMMFFSDTKENLKRTDDDRLQEIEKKTTITLNENMKTAVKAMLNARRSQREREGK